MADEDNKPAISQSVMEAIEHLGVDKEAIEKHADGKKITIKMVEAFAKKVKAEKDAQSNPDEDENPSEDKDDKDSNDNPDEDEGETKVKIVSKYVCVLDIKGEKKDFKAGDAYTGKNAKYLLSRGSIKEA